MSYVTTQHAIELDHLSCDELRKLACRVERRIRSLTEQTAEGKTENPSASCRPSTGSDDPKPAHVGASPTAGSVTRTTLRLDSYEGPMGRVRSWAH